MKIFIGSDHHGFEDKKQITDYLKSLGNEVVDEGDENLNPEDDFPVYAAKVAKQVLSEHGSRGVLLCGSGQGVCMAANRFKGIRASLCWDENEAFSSRNDDDANILCLSADRLDWLAIKQIIDIWLTTPFNGAQRFSRRIEELDKLG
jgi:ribose 5-phosphate isomerase B